MARLLLTGDAPLDRNIFYDPSETVGALLAAVIAFFRGEGTAHLLLSAGEGLNSRQILLKALQLAPSLLGFDLRTFWVSAARGDRQDDVLKQVYRHLSKTWLEYLPIRSLSPDINFLEEATEPGRHVDRIHSILSRLSSSNLVFVADLTKWRSDQETTRDYRETLERIASRTLVRNCLFITIVHQAQSRQAKGRSGIIEIPEVEARFEKSLNKLLRARRRGNGELRSLPSQRVQYERILAPWYAYGRPIAGSRSEFLTEQIPATADTIKLLLQEDLIYPLIADGYSLTVDGLQAASHDLKAARQQASQLADIAPNVLRIMDFMPPERLSEVRSDVQRLLSNDPTPSTLLRMIAAVMAPESGAAEWQSRLLEYLSAPKTLRQDSELVRNGSYSRIAINYLGQALLANAHKLDTAHFHAFETISYLYADSIVNKTDVHPSDILEASGWVYNIGYVYDRAHALERKTSISARKKLQSDAAALYALTRIYDAPLGMRLEVGFLKGLYQYNIGAFSESSDTFLLALRESLENGSTTIDSADDFDLSAGELAPSLFTNALRSAESCPPAKRAQIFLYLRQLDRHFVHRFGFSIFNDVVNSTDNGGKASFRSELWNFSASSKPDLGIVSHTAASGDTAYLGSLIFRELNLSVRCFSPDSLDALRKVDSDARYPLLVSGGPESRFGLGDFITEMDPSIKSLFQFISSGPVGIPIEIATRRPSRTVLATWSLGDSVRATRRWIRNAKETRMLDGTIVQQLLDNPIVSSITSKVGVKIIDRLVDAAVSAISKRMTKIGADVENDMAALKARIEPVFTAKRNQSMSGASPQRVAEEALSKVSTLEQRALLETLSGTQWIVVLEDALDQLRASSVSLAELQSILELLLGVATSAMVEGFRDERRRQKLIGFQSAFREFIFETDNMSIREQARSVRNNELVSDLMTRVFTSSTAFLSFLRE
ncbi:MAG: hypothetical protein WDN01_02960 [Rhizomicrobium sp.]